MNNEPNIPGMDDPRIPPRAVSVYGQDDAMDDFPVLKAFQQYIDAEQAKARKRMTTLAIFFGVFTLAVIAVFVSLLITASERNQKLNDRILEYVMKDRAQAAAPAAAPVVVQSPAQQDNSAIVAMTGKLEEMRKQLEETEARTKQAEKAAKEAAEKAAKEAAEALKPKPPSAEELEIQRLKALLSKEREVAAAEKEKRRQEELEAYRRKHYPELYAPKKPAKTVRKPVVVEVPEEEEEEDEEPVIVKPVTTRKTVKINAAPESVDAVSSPRPEKIATTTSPSDAERTPRLQKKTETEKKEEAEKNTSLKMSEIDDVLSLVGKAKAEEKPVAKPVDAVSSPRPEKKVDIPSSDAERTPRLQKIETTKNAAPATKTGPTNKPETKKPETKKAEEPKFVPQKEVSVTVEGKKASWRIPD